MLSTTLKLLVCNRPESSYFLLPSLWHRHAQEEESGQGPELISKQCQQNLDLKRRGGKWNQNHSDILNYNCWWFRNPKANHRPWMLLKVNNGIKCLSTRFLPSIVCFAAALVVVDVIYVNIYTHCSIISKYLKSTNKFQPPFLALWKNKAEPNKHLGAHYMK